MLSRFRTTFFKLGLKHDFKNSWLLQFNYTQNYFSNQDNGESREYGEMNMQCSYRNPSSNWSFHFNAMNLVNTKTQTYSSFTDVIVNQTQNFIQPFRGVVKTTYHF